MAIYNVNNHPTEDKIEDINYNDSLFYRVQNVNWEMGEKSWGMIYGTEEEAREAYIEEGLDPDDAILDGKSACLDAREICDYVEYDDYVVLIVSGRCVGEGHDGECVVNVDEIVEVWNSEEFIKVMWDMED